MATAELEQDRGGVAVSGSDGTWGVIGYRLRLSHDQLRIRAIEHHVPDSIVGLADACGISFNTMNKIVKGKKVQADSAQAVFAVLGNPGEDPLAMFEPVPVNSRRPGSV